MLKKFKLKHIDLITGKNVDYMPLMRDMLDYKHTRFDKVFRYKKQFKKMYAFIKEFGLINPTLLEYRKTCKIRKPESIDSITLIAMMEINMMFGSEDNAKRPIGELMADLISIACFSENINGEFDIDSYSYEKFRNRVLNEPAYEMIGLYNWIDEALKESSKLWSNLFFQVEVTDKDYIQAGGDIMNQFNVLNTIRTICKDFNVTIKQAWQEDYGVTQSNSLSHATQAFIQDKMAKIKEARMKAEQKAKGN
ncbi:MAG: hypothetical protein QQN55_03685 [Nitrosopumilus sp.]